MVEISILKKDDTKNGWKFTVNLDSDSYYVELSKDYWQKLTGSKISPEELIKKSFQFLLQKEPKEAILKEFNLKIISSYFPEYKEFINREVNKQS